MLAARSAERNDDFKEFAVKAQARFIELVFSDKTKVIAM